MNTATQSRWTDEFLNQQRLIGDPLADTVIAAIMTQGLKGEFDQLFRQLIHNNSYDTLASQNFPGFRPALIEIVKPYFAASRQMPPGLGEPFELNTAADQFADQLVPILLALHCKSLPLGYICANGAKVLHQAGRMVVHDQSLKPFTRRLLETAQFVNNLLDKNGFEPDGKAIISVQKVRLMHAAIRYYTKLRSWDVARHGEPINQEDLVLGHLTFSSVIITALRQFGIDVSAHQEQSYLYLWQTVAHILGVAPELVPQTQADGEYLLQRILDRQAAPSDEGAALTYACIEFVDGKLQWSPIKHVTPRLMRFLLGDTYARMLAIPGTPGPTDPGNPVDFSLISQVFPSWDKTNESHLLLKSVTRFALNSALDEGLKAYNEPPANQFFVPASLSDYLDQKNPMPLVAGPDAPTLPEAMLQLTKLAGLLKTLNNPLGLFAIACRELASRVISGNANNEFANKAHIEALYGQTINRFFREVNNLGQDIGVAGPWRVVFQSDKRLLTIDQHLLMAGYAHLAYDLPQTIAQQGPVANLVSLKADYEHILTLFTDVYKEVIDQLGQLHPDYGWLAGWWFEPARDALFNTFHTAILEAWSFIPTLTAGGVDQPVVAQTHSLATATVADALANPADYADRLQQLAERQFPNDQPTASAAAKIDALIGFNFK